MDTLSRREEETLLKSTKERALKECDPVVRGINNIDPTEFAECATGRTISVVWACRGEYRALQTCMQRFTNKEEMDKVRAEYIRLRRHSIQEGGVMGPSNSSAQCVTTAYCLPTVIM
ncbi:hypothetical protein BS47DRAFT_1286537 [Hydnum rufescens UP504]|uniref:COX assembly mitochondrial protein n=1 Tax=Hydnum rufescens UP504 TaxID=1448309 RepID=A0A9P6BBB4_9AGAM|nr:hypothetical protein BS47DRAFT_1286537 [Hydnum rufescens UP504]